MSKNIRVLYIYIVSFITLGMIVIGSISFVNGVASYMFPKAYGYGSYAKDENFKYDTEYIQSRKNNQRDSIRNSISSLATVALGTPLFIYHSKKASTLTDSKEEQV